MRADMAKGIAERWVHDVATRMPGFAGAFFHGGVTWLPDEAELPATSDLDLIIVVDGPLPDVKLGKHRVEGMLLDATSLPRDDVRSADQVLGRYHRPRPRRLGRRRGDHVRQPDHRGELTPRSTHRSTGGSPTS